TFGRHRGTRRDGAGIAPPAGGVHGEQVVTGPGPRCGGDGAPAPSPEHRGRPPRVHHDGATASVETPRPSRSTHERPSPPPRLCRPRPLLPGAPRGGPQPAA